MSGIKSRINELASKRAYGWSPDKIMPTHQYHDDLGMDDLDHTQHIMDLEEQFGVDLPDSDLANIRTVGDMHKLISKKLRGPMIKKSYEAGVKEAFDKVASITVDPGMLGALSGLLGGYYSGKQTAGATANILSQDGYKTKNETLGENAGKFLAPIGALGGMALGYKHKRKILDLARKMTQEPALLQLSEGLIPFGSGTLGGIATGAGVGGLASLRGQFSGKKKKEEKTASEVKIPEGGLRPGLLMNDLTQTMNDEDAALVRKNLPWYKRSGPGLLPIAGAGAIAGNQVAWLSDEIPSLLRDGPYTSHFTRKGALGAALGAAAFPAISYGLSRSGKFDSQALEAAKKAIEEARTNEAK